MGTAAKSDDTLLLLKIQNSKKPEEVIDLMWDKPNGCFVTQGLKELFGVNEIRIDSNDMLQSLEKHSHVLSFLLETLSEAKDLNLPYGFQTDFSFGNDRYTIHRVGDFRVLKEVGGE